MYSEVGMYLAMSRQADREGYPEVARSFQTLCLGRSMNTLLNLLNCWVTVYGIPRQTSKRRMNAECWCLRRQEAYRYSR